MRRSQSDSRLLRKHKYTNNNNTGDKKNTSGRAKRKSLKWRVLENSPEPPSLKEEICDKHVKTIELQRYASIPLSLGELDILEELDASRCELGCIPDVFWSLGRLATLELVTEFTHKDSCWNLFFGFIEAVESV
jgi:hypothetical protein